MFLKYHFFSVTTDKEKGNEREEIERFHMDNELMVVGWSMSISYS